MCVLCAGILMSDLDVKQKLFIFSSVYIFVDIFPIERVLFKKFIIYIFIPRFSNMSVPKSNSVARFSMIIHLCLSLS